MPFCTSGSSIGSSATNLHSLASNGTWLDRFSKRHSLPHINPHAFRHTMASMLYFTGVDSVSISKRLGHAQVSTTANIYAHVMEKADQRNADILADVFLKRLEFWREMSALRRGSMWQNRFWGSIAG